MKTTARKSTAARAKKASPPPKAKSAPLRTADHEKALRDYEDALKAFGRKDYSKAVSMFEAVIRDYPTEREIADRCRIYQGVARARGGPGTARPRDAEGHYYQGVIASNEGNLDEAAEHFERAVKMSPEMDKAWYAAAVVCAQRKDRAGALANLQRAVSISTKANRVAALNEPEFEWLREDAEFMAVLGKPPGGDA